MTPVFLGIMIGHYLDSRLGMHSFLIMLFLGFLAGARNGWLLIKRMLELDKEEDGKHEGT